MTYQNTSALSSEAKNIIDAISSNDNSFTKFIGTRFYNFHEKEILFFIKNSFDTENNDPEVFNKTLNWLSLASETLSSDTQTLMEIAAQNADVSEMALSIIKENKEKFNSISLISPLLTSHHNGNLSDKDFTSLSQSLIENIESDGKIQAKLDEYIEENAYIPSVKKFLEVQMSERIKKESNVDSLFDYYADVEEKNKVKKIINHKDTVQYLHMLMIKKEQENKQHHSLSSEDLDSYLSLIKELSKNKKTKKYGFSTIYDVTIDLIELANSQPHIEKNIRSIISLMGDELKSISAINDMIDSSIEKPKLIDTFLSFIKENNAPSTAIIGSLPVAAYINPNRKDEYISKTARFIRNSTLFMNILPVFQKTGHMKDGQGNEYHLNIYDKNYQYLAKTALYESKMAPEQVAALADGIRHLMESGVAREYLSDETSHANINSFNKFLKMAYESPIINQDETARNTFLASYFISEKTVALPPESKDVLKGILAQNDLQNGKFLNALINKSIHYEKIYNDELNSIFPSELYEETFSMIDKSLKSGKLKNIEKEQLSQGLNEIKKQEISHLSKEKITKLITRLSEKEATSTKISFNQARGNAREL
ncbi:MAG: hypothetical protein ACK5N8_05780 [Alphaproteobacteria bacterium]